MMHSDEKSRIEAYYDMIASDYGKQYDPENFYSLDRYPQNYFRLQILVTRLAQAEARRVYEVGVGEGTPLAMMARMGFDVAGCDISQNMVDATLDNLRAIGIETPDIQKADIEDPVTYGNQIMPPFDAAFAFGVIPHVHSPKRMLTNMRSMVRSGGKVFVEFRNKLFAMTTFNRLTYEFIMNDLLGDVDSEVVAPTEATVRDAVAMDLPPAPAGEADYSSIMANFHNPLELPDLFRSCGFENARIHWYHFHPGLPRHEKALGDAWRDEARKLEMDPSDWRGHFLCSAGVVEADAV